MRTNWIRFCLGKLHDITLPLPKHMHRRMQPTKPVAKPPATNCLMLFLAKDKLQAYIKIKTRETTLFEISIDILLGCLSVASMHFYYQVGSLNRQQNIRYHQVPKMEVFM